MKKDEFTHMVTLDCDYADKREQKIPIDKNISRMFKKVRAQAKEEHCAVCGKPCSSFCNSHSVPQFVLENIAENGIVMRPLQGELPIMGRNTGIKKAGTFHIICHDCDNTMFSDYENPDAYRCAPSGKMLAQLAAKDNLLMIDNRRKEIKLYDLLERRFENFCSPGSGESIEEIDLREYQNGLRYALRSLDKEDSGRYNLCYFRILDHVVPYATQTGIALIVDLEGAMINNIYNFSEDYKEEYLHVAVFPLREKSAIIIFVERENKRYRKFIKQLKKLDANDQLAVINYMIFCYTENIFLNPTTYEAINHDSGFQDACKKTAVAASPITKPNPLERAIECYDFSKRKNMPNLLSGDYALPKCEQM